MILFGLFCKLSNTVRLVGKRDYSYASTLINTGFMPCKTMENVMNSQNIICNKHNKKFNSNEVDFYLTENEFIKDKKLICVSPGGLRGFYQFGISSYIKQNYNLDKYIFSGASAGAWNSLFLCYKENPVDFVSCILDKNIYNINSILDLQYNLKYNLLANFRTENFDLQRLFIGISVVDRMKVDTNIYSDFEDLEDAIDGCIASSNIPFITGNINSKYHNEYGYDGGFTKYPYLNLTQSILHITPYMWELNYSSKYGILNDLLFAKNTNLFKLYYEGYKDTQLNKQYLDEILK
jgi:hypothetical protein